MNGIRTRRLSSGDEEVADRLFRTMAEVFGEAFVPLGDDYLEALLARKEFWAIAALSGEVPIGGLTAHTLPMTSSPSSEIFIYDVAVRGDFQRKGVGRHLIVTLQELAAAAGIREMFVPADHADQHALDFYRSLGGSLDGSLGGEETPVSLFTFHKED